MPDEVLDSLYTGLTLYNRPDFEMPTRFGSLADLASQDFLAAQKQLDALAQERPHPHESFRTYGADMVVFYSDGTVDKCLKNERFRDGLSYQELYLRTYLPAGHRLHVVAAERKREKERLNGQLDIGIYVTNEHGQLTFQDSFTYSTSRRSSYVGLLCALVSRTIIRVKYNPAAMAAAGCSILGIGLNGRASRAISMALKGDAIRDLDAHKPTRRFLQNERHQVLR